MTNICELCLTTLKPKQIRRAARFCSHKCYYQAIANKKKIEQPAPEPEPTTPYIRAIDSFPHNEEIAKKCMEWSLQAVMYYKCRGEEFKTTDRRRIVKQMHKELNIPFTLANAYMDHATQTLS